MPLNKETKQYCDCNSNTYTALPQSNTLVITLRGLECFERETTNVHVQYMLNYVYKQTIDTSKNYIYVFTQPLHQGQDPTLCQFFFGGGISRGVVAKVF